MDAEAIIAVSAAISALTQFVKWQGLDPRYAPISVLILSAIGVALYGYSSSDFQRDQIFSYFAAWIAVSLAAAGVFGFTRALPQTMTSHTPPPIITPPVASLEKSVASFEKPIASIEKSVASIEKSVASTEKKD